ncbi:hypothetical protein M4914_14005 [Streptomyces somaliensis DSM 40738]|uniref:Uncharacterized protein n=1 Tax=Streptomyces somaliensis (strain ATCC 33201 / DSM 40738 / JCM 12659 / KCTC 9044 / NCTC 11332 / NRRL B-12077 / IP 733) TaxID=1134445 RepID=A0AA44DEV4_STRE0|nr:hypothetical protein [Streptomyces somaliensis]MCQ0023957.1 hypothetical protein [Streptomyces somaliensis DSM 40738]NKY15598.1 hypothetical protein [Streptomyces somaliensis DSM 40738]
MSASETSRYVRLRVDLVLEVTERDRLTDAALLRIRDDEFMPDEERAHAGAAVREDEAEALAYLVEPSRLTGGVPGVELVQASWSSERAAHDPDADAWRLDDDLDDDLDGDLDGGPDGGPGGDDPGESDGRDGEEGWSRDG